MLKCALNVHKFSYYLHIFKILLCLYVEGEGMVPSLVQYLECSAMHISYWKFSVEYMHFAFMYVCVCVYSLLRTLSHSWYKFNQFPNKSIFRLRQCFQFGPQFCWCMRVCVFYLNLLLLWALGNRQSVMDNQKRIWLTKREKEKKKLSDLLAVFIAAGTRNKCPA